MNLERRDRTTTAPDSAVPRHSRRQRARTVLAVVLLTLIYTAIPAEPHAVRAQAEPDDAPVLKASGVIHAHEVLIASEYGGHIEQLLVREGQPVSAGARIVHLDTALLDAQIEAAEATVAMAQARLDQAQAGTRPGQIAVARAQLAQAQAARVAATQAVSDTAMLLENPQDLLMQIAVTRQQIQSAQIEIEQTLAIKDAAEVAKDQFEDAQSKIMDAGGPGTHRVPVPGAPPGTYYEYSVPSLPLEMHLTPNQWWQAWVAVNAADANKKGLEASLSNLYAQYANPQDLRARADEALALLAQAKAQVLAAQAQLDGLQAGATPQQLDALRARITQTRAALDSLRAQRERMEITAPIDGIVISLPVHQGEVAAPGATLATLADLAQVTLTVYLPETQVGRAHLNQRVGVTVDSFPDRVFEGTITHIADTAEFTPRNVATQEERVNLVFAVEIELKNDHRLLKPGMPADATFD